MVWRRNKRIFKKYLVFGQSSERMLLAGLLALEGRLRFNGAMKIVDFESPLVMDARMYLYVLYAFLRGSIWHLLCIRYHRKVLEVKRGEIVRRR